jgi:hypothetical protein
MAIDPHPDVVRCANTWRHGKAPKLPAVAFVRDAARDAMGFGFWTPRCQDCVNSLAAANPASARAHVVYIDRLRVVIHDDDDPAARPDYA